MRVLMHWVEFWMGGRWVKLGIEYRACMSLKRILSLVLRMRESLIIVGESSGCWFNRFYSIFTSSRG